MEQFVNSVYDNMYVHEHLPRWVNKDLFKAEIKENLRQAIIETLDTEEEEWEEEGRTFRKKGGIMTYIPPGILANVLFPLCSEDVNLGGSGYENVVKYVDYSIPPRVVKEVQMKTFLAATLGVTKSARANDLKNLVQSSIYDWRMWAGMARYL